jgi:hypothetical protein
VGLGVVPYSPLPGGSYPLSSFFFPSKGTKEGEYPSLRLGFVC